MPTITRLVRFFFLLTIILALSACGEGLSPEEEFDRKGRLSAARDATLVAEATLEAQTAAAPAEPPPAAALPNGSPQIELKFTAENMRDLPVYRANLSTPINIDQQSAAPWPARMQAQRTDDLQQLGGLQAGTVRQITTFEGTYDPGTGKLTGTLTHQYFSDAQGSADALAATTDYRLTCALEAQRVGDSDTINGVCRGQSTWEYRVPGHSDYNKTENKSVNYTVTGTLPEALRKGP